MDCALVEFQNHRFLLGLQASEGERLFAPLLFFWKIPRSWRCVKGWPRVTPGKSREPHPFITRQGMAADLGVQGVPANGNLLYDQRVEVSAPVKGLRLTRINVLPPVAGVLTTFLYCWTHVRWMGPVLKVLTEGRLVENAWDRTTWFRGVH